MKLYKALTISFTIVCIGLTILTTYLFLEVRTLKMTGNTMTDSDVVAIVDARLVILERQRISGKLTKLEHEYALAAESTPDNRMIYGDLNASLTLQEFGDIECPYCRKMHSGLKQVIDHSKGVINWEFKHFPLPSHNPAAAAESLIIGCIGESYGNRKAWVALDMLIAETRGNGKGITSDSESFTRSLGLNGSIVDNCISSNKVKISINKDFEDGRRLDISSTPAIRVINNTTKKEYLIKGYKTPEQLLEIINSVMK